MAGNNTISITFKLDGDGKGFKQLANDADGFKKAMTGVINEGQKLNAKAINFAAIATGLDQAQQSITQLQGVIKDLTSAYADQREAETKLENAMRSNMSAREEDISAIKRLCSAQQELGVIGDEVQLAGAQQLAVFVKQRESLEALIPAMNDIIAKQYGLNATQGSAESVATMLGKALNGQTRALKSLGLVCNEAQEKMLKYGSESEKVAAITELVQSKMGGMNAELARTDLGKQKQLENTLGDIKETLGGLVAGIQPYITLVATTTTAITGITKLTLAVKSAAVAVAGWNIKTKLLNATLLLSGFSSNKAAKAINLFSVANKGAMASTVALKIAIRGLMAATGVGLAIAALTAIIEHFVTATDKATDSTDDFLDASARAKRMAEDMEQAQRAENESIQQSSVALATNITKLKEFSGSKEKEKKLVTEMNNLYGETMGYFSSVSEWYKTLTANSKTYTEQLTLEARARLLANQIAKNTQDAHDIMYDANGKKRKYSAKRKTRVTDRWESAGGAGSYRAVEEIVGSSDLEKANAAIQQINNSNKSLNKQLNDIISKQSKLSMPVKGASTAPTFASSGSGSTKHTSSVKESTKATTEATKATDEYVATVDEAANTLAGYDANVAALTYQLNNATSVEDAAAINKQKEYWKGLGDAIRNAGNVVDDNTPKWHDNAATLDEISENLQILDKRLQSASTTNEAANINKQRKAWEDKAEAIRMAGLEAKNTFSSFKEGYSVVKGVGDGVQALTDTLNSNSSAWKKITGIVDAFVQIYESLHAIVGMLAPLFKTQTASQAATATATVAATTATTEQAVAADAAAAALVPAIAANKEAAASAMELATAEYMAAHAYIPFAGFGIAAGYASAAKALTLAMGATPFANGGVLYGPTLGLLGEYAGASNNPEVVAPLDKLRNLIEPQGIAGEVVFKIDGRELKGVLKKVDNLSYRS